MDVSISVRSSRLDSQLDALGGEIRDRQKYARKIGGYVRSLARKNIKGQRTVGGDSFTPRQRRYRARAERKMLQGLASTLAVISKADEGGGAAVGWRHPYVGVIARRHQDGIGKEWSASYAKGRRGTPDYKAPCTRKQAQALIRSGYRHHYAGKKGPGKRVTVMQLQKQLTLGQAGLILRVMVTGKAKGVQRWTDAPPPRPFLGVTDVQAEEQCEKMAKAIAKAALRGKK